MNIPKTPRKFFAIIANLLQWRAPVTITRASNNIDKKVATPLVFFPNKYRFCHFRLIKMEYI